MGVLLTIASLLGNPIVRYLGMAAAVAALIWYLRFDAARDAVKAYELKIERAVQAERERIQKINEETMRQAEHQIEELAKRNKQLQEQLEKNDEEARADPDGGSCGVKRRGVQRINRIR